MQEIVSNSIKESIELTSALKEIEPFIVKAGEIIWECISKGGKLIIMGNGGSAADAQHIAAEMVGRFEYNHAPIPALALTTNSSILTAVSNDFGFNEVYYRQMASLLQPKDVVLAISTSGSSENINLAVKFAKEMKVPIVGLTGKDGGLLKSLCSLCIIAPSARTCRIQEAHIIIGHILCEIIEKKWIKSGESQTLPLSLSLQGGI